MAKRIEAWGNVLEFPDDMPDSDIAAAIQKNEANLNPDASTFTKAKSAVSGGIDAGLSMLSPKKSIADQAQEQSASSAGLSAPQVKGVPVRRDFYNRMVENPVENAAPGVVSRVRDAAANDSKAQGNKRAVAKALVSTEPVPEEGGFISSAGRTIGQNIKGAGQAAADFIPGVGQDNAVKRFGQDVIDANPTAVNSLEDIADRPGAAVTEATGNAVPSMAGMVGARALGQGITALSPLAGPIAPVVAAVGQVVSWLGPAAIAALPSYGGIRDKQIIDDPKNEESAKAKAIAALGAGAVGAIEQAFGPQQWALAALTKEGRVQLAKKFAATSLPGAVGKGMVKGAAIEGAEELAQNPIEQLAAFDNPTTPENLKETAFGGAMGAIGGGVLGGGIPVIAGKPVTEHSDRVLRYTAQRGGERAKAASQAELDRRATQGVDPAVANAPESTSEAVDRIISTGRDKTDEIRENAASEPDAIQSGIFDEEPDHVEDVLDMVDESQQGAPDAPTPEPVETLNAQLNALAAGNKPGVLLTPGEPMPDTLPDGVRAAEIPGRGMLLYRDNATLQAALNGQMGTALGYGIDEKPAGADQVVTARDQNGSVIQDVATDGNPQVEQAAAAVAGPGGSVEVRTVQEAMAERASSHLDSATAKSLNQFGYSTEELAAMSPTTLRDTWAAMKIIQKDRQFQGIPHSGADWAERREAAREISDDIASERVQLPKGGLKVPVQNRSSTGYAHGRLEEAEKDLLEWAKGNRQGAIDALKQEIEEGRFLDDRGVYNMDLLDFMTRKMAGPKTPARETRPTPPPSIEDKSREAKLPARDSLQRIDQEPSGVQSEAAHPLRPLVESLIKRRAAAKQGGKDLSNAVARAKEVLDGKRTDSIVENRWFRLQAKAFERADQESANILRQISDAVKSTEELKNGRKAGAEKAGTESTKGNIAGHGVVDGGRNRESEKEGEGSARGLSREIRTPKPSNKVLEKDSPKFSRASIKQDEFVKAPDGSLDFGQITQEIAGEIKRQAAPIRLPQGVQNSDGSGYGLAHIEANHGKHIRNSGFESVEKFIAHVAKDFSQIWQGTARQLLVAVRNGRQDMMYVQLEPADDVDYYRVNSAFPVRQKDYPERHGFKVLWEGSEPASVASGKQPAFAVGPESESGQDDPNARGQSDSTIPENDSKFNRSRVDEVRQRLKAAEDRAKQATPPGGLSVSGLQKLRVQTIVDAIRSQWKNAPEIVVVDDMSDPAIRKAVRDENERQMSQGATGQPEGFFDQGRVYIVASQMNSPRDVVRVLFHETLGHFGLRGAFGKELRPILKQIAALRRADVEAKAQQYGFDMSVEKDRLLAAEEVLAEMAQTNPQISFVKRAIAAIRTWLRENIPFLADMKLSDAEVINNFLMPAREFVQGASREQDGMVPAFSRAPQTDSAAFKKWFGDSKVVDKDGNPLVVYHQTNKDAETKILDEGFTTKFGRARLSDDQVPDGIFFKPESNDIGVGTADRDKIAQIPTFVTLKNPFTIESRDDIERAIGDATYSKLAKITSDTDNRLAAEFDAMWNKLGTRSRPAQITNGQWDEFAQDWERRVDSEGKSTATDARERLTQVLKDRGYDGMIIEKDKGSMGRVTKTFIAFESTQIKSATGNNGEFDAANPNIRFSRSVPSSNASWDSPEPSKIDDLIYKLQNKHVDLKRVIEAVRDTGVQLADKWNTYLQEELFHGRAAKRTQDFVNKELKPIIAGLRLRGLTVDELDKYLHARHAEEANNLIAQRDPNMPNGGSGMTTQEAKDYLANLPAEKKRKLEQVAAKVDAVIAQTRDLYVSYGLVDKDTADSWKNMFTHYVPLMREDHDGGMGIGQGFSIKGKEVKHRTGSRRKVVDILANIALQRERAIVRGEKNRVAVSLAGLAKLNPNPDFWTFDKVPTEKVLNEATGQVEERPVPNFKSRDNVVVAKIRDSKGKVQERAVIFNEHDERAMRMAQALKNLDATQLEGLLGTSAMITRYFAAINTQYNPVFGIVNLTRDLQASLLNLSSTPIAGHKAEVLKNVGPAILAIYSASRGDRKGKQSTSPMAALWDEMQQEGGMTGYRDLFKTSEDRANAIKRELDPTAWMNSGWGKIFTAGGALKVPLAVAQKRAGWLFDWLSDYNQTLEGAMRLSVYKTAIDNGVSKQRAASLAKNISVNFNRKGQSGQQAGALYAFFNAATQGTARIGETMTRMEKGDIKTFRFNRAGRRIIAGGITLGAMQALALAAAGFDDDEPPEFVRERSLVIPIGDKKYITVPMPLGFHAIPNIGRLSTEFALGGFKNPADYTAKLFAVFAEAFNPIGSAGFSIQTIAPTAIDPLVALSENKDWTGKPIAKEDFNKLSPTPGFSRNKDTASDPSKWIAEAINTISGGNKYVPGVASPTADQIDYLFGQVTGGVGREAGKAQQSLKAMYTGEELPPHKIPLVGRFYGNSENQSSQGNAFYSNLKRINEVEVELKGRRKDRLPIDDFKAENPEYRLVARANLIERLVSKQRKLKSELIEKDAPKEQVKAIDERITKLMAGLNQRVKELKQGQQAAR